MPMNVQWDSDAKNIIRAVGEGNWTWDDFHHGVDEIVEMMNTVDHRVDLIYMSLPGAVPPKGSPMPHYKRAIQSMPANAGQHIIVNTMGIARVILNVFLKLYGRQSKAEFGLAATLDDARKMISQKTASP